MSATGFDLRHPEAVARELEEANNRLAREREVPAAIIDLIDSVSLAIGDAEREAIATVDPYVWIQVQGAAIRAQHAARIEDEREQRRAVRIALEEVRFLLARLAERQPVAEDQPVNSVLQWLDEKLPVSQRRKAELLGVGERTYQRWISPQESAAPEGDLELRARVVARLAAQLRHVLTGPGVVDWFETPAVALDGRKPIDALSDPTATDRLVKLAAGLRSISAA